MEREIWEVLKALEENHIIIIAAHQKLCQIMDTSKNPKV